MQIIETKTLIHDYSLFLNGHPVQPKIIYHTMKHLVSLVTNKRRNNISPDKIYCFYYVILILQ